MRLMISVRSDAGGFMRRAVLPVLLALVSPVLAAPASAQSTKPQDLESAAALREFNDMGSERFAIPAQRYEQAHLEIARRIVELERDIAAEQGTPYEPDRPDNVHRLNMGVFPVGASIIPNPYNKIPGFTCHGAGGGSVHFVPGFPVMAWPMMEWVLDTHYPHLFQHEAWIEQSVIIYGSMEATLTPLMEALERDFDGVKVFSLPSVDHATYGRHIELGVKGEPEGADRAYLDLRQGLKAFALEYGPELVR